MRTIDLDVAIIGGGLAGSATVLHLHEKDPELKVGLFIKSPYSTTNSYQAQGGIAASLAFPDSPEIHLHDTLIAGAGKCDVEAARLVTDEAPDAVHQLEKWGVPFDKKNGRLVLGREGGHSHFRVAKVRDQTGKSIMDNLWSRVVGLPNISLFENLMVIDIHWEIGGIRGFTATDGNEVVQVNAPQVVLATGGMGQLFEHTSNPIEATGDGLAIARRAGFPLMDLPFVQFHPTCLFDPRSGKVRLITEALRGAGALLVNKEGNRIMSGVHDDMELAPRDIVSRAIFSSLKKGENVFLDATGIPENILREEFSGFWEVCVEMGLDPTSELIPIFPSAHYSCGGIVTDLQGRVGVKGLYALGECARTGLHGANRLASNSLLEALVFARLISEEIVRKHYNPGRAWFPQIRPRRLPIPLERIIQVRKELGKRMELVSGVVKSEPGMKLTLRWVNEKKKELFGAGIVLEREGLELRNLLEVAEAYLEQCLKQQENVGTFYCESRIGA